MTGDPAAASDPPAAWGPLRSKTVSWFDPLISASGGASLSGIQHLHSIIAGELPPPPIAALFGFRLVSADAGESSPSSASRTSRPTTRSAWFMVASYCTLLDSVIGCAVQSTLPAGVGYTSIEIKVNYMRGLHAHAGELRARGWGHQTGSPSGVRRRRGPRPGGQAHRHRDGQLPGLPARSPSAAG